VSIAAIADRLSRGLAVLNSRSRANWLESIGIPVECGTISYADGRRGIRAQVGVGYWARADFVAALAGSSTRPADRAARVISAHLASLGTAIVVTNHARSLRFDDGTTRAEYPCDLALRAVLAVESGGVESVWLALAALES
jgi:hypothetical protein